MGKKNLRREDARDPRQHLAGNTRGAQSWEAVSRPPTTLPHPRFVSQSYSTRLVRPRGLT